MTAKPFDRAKIMRDAHTTARYRLACGVPGSYAKHLAAALAYEWQRAKQFRAAAEARRAIAAEARLAQNVGLPVRSCFADVARSPARFRSSQFVARAFAG